MNSHRQKSKEDVELQVNKMGLHLIMHKFERTKCITKDDINVLFADLGLPDKPAEKLAEEMTDCGGDPTSNGGFTKLSNFFIFLLRNLAEFTTKEMMMSFRMFDSEMTGFMDIMLIMDIMENMGDVMGEGEINQLISVSITSEQGALNYEEAVRTSTNRVMEEMFHEMTN